MGTITSDNNFGTAKLIVDSVAGQGNYTTIASALTAASSGDTIFIRPGTYTENLTLKAGVDICSFVNEGFTPNVTIIGKCTCTFSGTASISGIRFQTNSDYIFESTGSNTMRLEVYGCYLNCTNFSGIHCTNANATFEFLYCKGDLGTTGISLMVLTAGNPNFSFTNITNTGSSTTLESIGGSSIVGASRSGFGVGFNTTSTATINFSYCSINPPASTVGYQQDASAISVLSLCSIAVSGVAAVVINASVLRVFNCHMEGHSTYVAEGSGSLVYDFITSGNVNSALDPALSTTARRIFTGSIDLANNLRISSGSGSPSGSLTAPKGSLYLRTDGSSTSTRAYINTNGGTTWTAITTAS